MTRAAAGNSLATVKLINLDHVGIAVADLDGAVAAYSERYRVHPVHRGIWEPADAEEAFIPVGGSFVQLIAPLTPTSPVAAFLDDQGEGLHHVAYAVASLTGALEALGDVGARLSWPEPRVDSRGARTIFVEPDGVPGSLIELVEPSDA